MRDTILWRLRAQECAWIDCDTKYEWTGDIRNNEMKITKTQLKQIIKEELSNIYKLCPAGTKCAPESKKTKWWRGK